METEKFLIYHLINDQRITMMLAILILNLITVSAIIIPKFILNHRRDFAISLYLFNFVIFALCYVLSKTEIGFGAGIGLFAVFAMLRFRSEMLNLQDMTYLLVIISIGFVNATFNGSVSFLEILLLNVGLCSMTHILDCTLSQQKLKCKKVKYGNLDLIKPDKSADLVKDLVTKTGLEILKVQIDSIDLNDHSANVKIYYREMDRKNGYAKRTLPASNKIAPIAKFG